MRYGKRDIGESAVHDDRWVKSPAWNARARLRLFCFPYAGGAASHFRRWPEYLSTDIELCAVQLPGRENRIGEPLFTRLDRLVARLADVLPPYLDRPFVFYGHSMGALIAFELARELRRRQWNGPACLLVSGRRAPQVPDPGPPLHRLTEAEFKEGLRRYNGTPEAVFNNSDLMELLVPLLRADFEICETYEHRTEPPLDCPIAAFAGADERCAGLLDGWRAQTTNVFHAELFQGDHFFLNTARAEFVSAIGRRLDRIANESAPRPQVKSGCGAGVSVQDRSVGE